MFGEEDIILKQKRTFTVRCESAEALAFMIKPREFYNLIYNEEKDRTYLEILVS